MRPAVLLLALSAPGLATPRATPIPEQTDLPVAFARWTLPGGEPEGGAALEVGEALVVALEVEHPAGALVELPSDPAQPLFAHPWLLLEELPIEKRRRAPGPVPGLVPGSGATPEAGGGAAHLTDALTRYAWRVTRLAPGEALLPTLDLMVGHELVTAVPLALRFASALGPVEDRPRPPAGFHEPEFEAAAPFFTPLVRASLWAAAGLLVLLLFLRALARRKRARAAAPPDPALLLSALEADLAAGGAAARSAHYELTGLVREVVDRRVGRSRSAATDSEWLAALGAEPGIDAATLESCARVLERAADVKYAGRDVTRWAAEETLAAARALVEFGEPGKPDKHRPGRGAQGPDGPDGPNGAARAGSAA